MGVAFESGIAQPLDIPKAALIEMLNAKIAEAQAARQAAQDAITSRRKAAQDAVASLSPDELLNLVTRYVNSDLDQIVTMVQDAHETGRLKSQEMQVSDAETRLEKFVRVLTAATTDPVQIEPTDPIYPLL